MEDLIKMTTLLGWFAGLYANEPLIFIPCTVVMIAGGFRELVREIEEK